MKKAVLLKSKSSQQGGLEKYASRIALGFVKKGFQVTILTTGETPPSEHPNIHISSIKTTPWPGFLRMEEFDAFVRDFLKKNPAEIIFGMDRNREQTHIRAGNGVHAAYLESRLHTEGRLKVAICKLNPLHRKILSLEREAFEHAGLKKLFTNSHKVKKEILERYNTDPAKIEVIHNGVEWKEMIHDFGRWEEKKEELVSQMNIEKDAFIFLFVGNGYLRKGLSQLLFALSFLKTHPFYLLVIGKENQEAFFRKKASQLGLQDKVLFLGAKKETRPFYQLADALIIPSFYDPFANVTIEALAMGLYVVSSKENGASEIIPKGSGSLIENLLEPESIVEALKKAFSHKKSKESSLTIRNEVASLDFSNQLQKLFEACE